MNPLGRFVAYYGVLFAGFGVASPFLPSLLAHNGLPSGQLGLVLAAGTAIRLLTGPLGGRITDRLGLAPLVLAGFTGAAALVALGYAPARGLVPLLVVSVAHAAVLAPLTPVADSLALGASQRPGGFPYGWVRGAGSAAFIAGTLLSGRLVGAMGEGVIVWLNAGLLAAAAAAALLLPGTRAGQADQAGTGQDAGFASLFRIPAFAVLLIVAALVGGSHALHDGFEVIRWRSAGMSAQRSSVLWAFSVAAEVVVFVGIGPRLLGALGPSRALLLAAAAGIVRWSAAALTAWFPVMALVEPLHGLTFALLHLACMEVIARVVPAAVAATAQALYGTVAMGLSMAAFTLVSGTLYDRLGAGSFWIAAALCALALPATWTLGRLLPAPWSEGGGADTAVRDAQGDAPG